MLSEVTTEVIINQYHTPLYPEANADDDMDNTPSSVTGWTPIHQQRNATKRNVIRQFKLTSKPLLPYTCSILMSLIDRWHSILFEGLWEKIEGFLDWNFN